MRGKAQARTLPSLQVCSTLNSMCSNVNCGCRRKPGMGRKDQHSHPFLNVRRLFYYYGAGRMGQEAPECHRTRMAVRRQLINKLALSSTLCSGDWSQVDGQQALYLPSYLTSPWTVLTNRYCQVIHQNWESPRMLTDPNKNLASWQWLKNSKIDTL